MSDRAARRVAAWAALIVCLAGVLYAPSLDHPFVIDDFVYIVENRAVTSGAPLASYFLDRRTTASSDEFAAQSYRPLRTVAFRLIARVAGVLPRAFGGVNRVAYGISIVCVLLLMLRVTRDTRASLWAAALWAFAPVHVEPVVYASSLGDHLSLLLEMAALACGGVVIGGGAIGGDPGVPAPKRRLRIFVAAVASLVLAALAMLAKEMAVTSGLLLLAWVWCSARRTLPTARSMLLAGAHLVLAAAYVAVGTAVRGGPLGHASIDARSLAQGLRVAPVLLIEYTRLIVAPLGHHAGYVLPEPTIAHTLGALVVVAAIAVAAWRSRSHGIALGLAWFALTLLPVLQIVPILADLADRFALVPSVGLAVAMAALLSALPERRRRIADLLCAIAVLLFCAGTIVEQRAWSSEAALWTHSLELEPRSAQAHANLGVVHLVAGRPAEALAELEQARALGRRGASLEFGRALALDALGRADEAHRAVDLTLAEDPRHGAAHALRGDLLLRRGSADGAVAELAEARRLAPDHPSVVLLAALLAERAGRPAAARRELATLVARQPTDARFQYLHGRAALLAGDVAAALAGADACLSLEPAQPQCDCLRGRALAISGRHDEARAALDRAIPQLPNDTDSVGCREARRRLPW